MSRSIVLSSALLLTTGCIPSPNPDESAFSPEEAERLGWEVNLENWDDGGELSRFAFLSIPKIFTTAAIRRGDGEVLALETADGPLPGRGRRRLDLSKKGLPPSRR